MTKPTTTDGLHSLFARIKAYAEPRRKRLLVASLLLMGIASTAIGLLPGYDTIGIAAVVGLVFLRLLQGVGARLSGRGADSRAENRSSTLPE